MGRSKKSWDHLVDYRGNYGINVEEGYFPGSPNRPGIKGNKGEVGFKGQKGQEGDEGTTGAKGAVGPKGDPGPYSVGPKGQKGDAAGLFLFQGVVSGTDQLPLFNQQPGYTYYVSGENKLYVWDGTQWVPMQDVLAPIKGDEGDEGAQGPKGEPGLDGTDGGRGFDGPKGEKGEKGDDVLLDDFYTQDQIDAILENLYHPEEAFHINFNTKTNSEILVGTVNFESQAQDAPIYNLGLVTIGQQVTVLNSPVPADRLMVVNYVVEDPGQSRGLDYTLLQFVYNGAPYEVTDFAYYRRCRPGMGEFSEWRAVGIKKEDYYTKGEIDTLFIEKARQYELKTFPHPDEDNQYIRLEELNYGSTSDVQVRGIGGIKITRNQNVLTWDASPLTGQIQFLGMIDAPDDPSVKKPDATPGQYYMYNVGGTAWNGEEVVEGDWVIFGADPEQWNNVDMTQNYGVLNVSVEGGLLEQTGTVNFPNIILEEDTIRDQILYEYLTFDQTAAIFAGQGIQDHNNVVIQTRNNGQQGHYDKPLAAGEPPTFQNGAFSVVTDRNEIQFNKFDSTGTEMDQLLAQAQPGVKHRFEGLAGQGGTYDAVVTDTGNYGGYFYIRYETISPVAMVMAAGEFRVRAYDGLLADDGDSLLYDSTSDLWVPGEAGAGTFVRLKGDTMEGELNMDGNAIKGLPYDPPTDDSAVTKKWVLDQIAAQPDTSVPVGTIAFWPKGGNAPSGWFFCNGGSFDTTKYPKLHQFLNGLDIYPSRGRTPNLNDRWLGQIGTENGNAPGKFKSSLTKKPSNDFVTNKAGAHSHTTVGMNNRKMSAAPNTGRECIRPYGIKDDPSPEYPTTSHDGHTHKIASGGDSITRPPTVTGYWIIKHD
jgi:microcystin-dependent protein